MAHLILALMPVTMAAPLLLSLGINDSVMVWTAAFMASIVVCMIDQVITCAFLIFSYFLWVCLFETVLCESTLLGLPHESALLRLPLVCFVETYFLLLIPCNVTCLNDDETTGYLYDMHYVYIGMHIVCLIYMQYIQLHMEICGQ